MEPFPEHLHGRGSSWKGLLITASILRCWMPPTSAKGAPVRIVPRPPYGTVGSNITLTIEGFSKQALSYNWYRRTTENSNRIVSYSVLTGVQTPAEIRERVQPDGFLFIPVLTLRDTDLYIVQIVDARGVIAAIVRGKLGVYEKVAKPNITVNSTNVGENDSVFFTCSTEKEGVNIWWLANNQPLSLNERMNMTHNNQTLVIMSAKRTDAGSYQCEAANPISSNRSDSQILTVNYGPDHIEILPSPENGEIEVQFNTSFTLECRALSYSSVHYEWHDINGSVHSESTFSITPTSWERKKYTCWARNNVTNSSISKDITIKVVEIKFPKVARTRIMSIILIGMAAILVLIVILVFKRIKRIIKDSMPSNARDHRSQVSSSPKLLVSRFSSTILREGKGGERDSLSPPKAAQTSPCPPLTPPIQEEEEREQRQSGAFWQRQPLSLIPRRSTSRVCPWALPWGDTAQKGKVDIPGKERRGHMQRAAQSDGASLKASPHWGQPLKRLLMAVSILSCWIKSTSVKGAPVSVVPSPPYGRLGSNVTLTIHGFSEQALSYNWYRKTTEDSNRIISYSVPSGMQIPAGIREKVYPNGFLLIPNLTLSDTELYIVQIVDSRGVIAVIARGQLGVYDKVAKPNIAVNSTNNRENDSVFFTCSTENKEENILWFSNNQPLSLSERMSLSRNNQTLTILSVKREDTGSYQCQASNPISSNRSDPLTLTVIYGPSHIQIFPRPESGEIKVQLNDPLTLECQALSYPAAQYEWHVNGTSGSVYSGRSYIIPSASWEHSGKYTCWTRNNVTNLSISKDIIINVIGKSPRGAIVGIVSGVLAGLVLTASLIYVLFFRKTSQSCSDGSPNGTEEVSYASIIFNTQKSCVLPRSPMSIDTIYSEIKKK
ncbi:uncharacterized protein LOC123240851 [Gracilinanus agilis]|uniref:uncharacterized protein LOC123240851 n=1 Tax=Gracilinanus agilis TaxID=191870 RepID=UPI001CFC4711|nr:uncharacterized protein LOC123240851 [Gracilinanus agilis]